MQVAVSMVLGFIVGIGLFFVTRKNSALAVWTALVLGLAADILLVGSMFGWIFPEMGRFGAIGLGVLAGVGTVLAVGCVVRGERKPLNWVALVVAAAPVLFLIVFGIGELVGPPH